MARSKAKTHNRRPNKLKEGDVVHVKVGGVTYKTKIINGVQRFVENKVVTMLLEQPGGLDLNELAHRYADGQFSQRDYAEFNMMLGYSVGGFCDLSSFYDMEIDNPIWGKKVSP